MTSLTALERRVLRIEDIEEIKQLKFKCSLYADLKDRESFVRLFVEHGSFGSQIMQLRGHDELRTVSFWPFQVHYSLNPLIEVHGDRAVGKWYFFRPHTTHENVARWAGGYYDDEYVRDEGVWKFESIRLTNWYLTPYDTGFAVERGAPPQLEEQYLDAG